MDVADEIDSLLQSSCNMMLLTKQGENQLDSMLTRAHRVASRISSMYKYEKLLLDMQDLTVYGKRRKLILNDLQRENKQIMALQDENRQLRETTEEYLTTMRDILESHAELESTIEMQHQNKEVDDIDNLIFEMVNTNLEARLKEKALKMQQMMDELEKLRKTEYQELQLAVQANKNYKELFKMACFSNPSAISVLKSAMKAVSEDSDSKEPIDENETQEGIDLNETIIHKENKPCN
uniref:FGFR1 oncogene partner 2 homolog n=1 Tax=Caenorhabditis tropicalis TaxID=1561998 RepID=A0A1I7UHZ8_9PELO